jgi:hypothetical protein
MEPLATLRAPPGPVSTDGHDDRHLGREGDDDHRRFALEEAIERDADQRPAGQEP